MYINFEFRFRAKRCKTCGEKSGRFELCKDCYDFELRQREELRLRREENYRLRAAR